MTVPTASPAAAGLAGLLVDVLLTGIRHLPRATEADLQEPDQ